MPWAMLAIAVIQMGMQIQQQSEQRAAVAGAKRENAQRTVSNQSALTEQQQRRRRQAQGATTLGGDNQTFASRQVSEQGTILGQSNQMNRSLLGG